MRYSIITEGRQPLVPQRRCVSWQAPARTAMSRSICKASALVTGRRQGRDPGRARHGVPWRAHGREPRRGRLQRAGLRALRIGDDPPSKLVELVRQPRTKRQRHRRRQHLFEAAGLTVAVCSDQPGRIIDRLVRPNYNAALRLLDEGLATAKDMDLTCRLGLGYPGRPHRARRARRPRAPSRRDARLVRRLRHARLCPGAAAPSLPSSGRQNREPAAARHPRRLERLRSHARSGVRETGIATSICPSASACQASASAAATRPSAAPARASSPTTRSTLPTFSSHPPISSAPTIPTPWTSKIMGEKIFRNASRTACRQVHRFGRLRGAYTLAARWSEAAAFANARADLQAQAAKLIEAHLAVRAEIWQAVAEGTGTRSIEQGLRGARINRLPAPSSSRRRATVTLPRSRACSPPSPAKALPSAAIAFYAL